MRKTTFRGKRVDNGEWVEGFYGHSGDKTYIIIDNDIAVGYFRMREVIPETVGQYTGLTDKNGNRIFEGDIVHCKSRWDNANMVVIFECGQFRMVLSENYRSYQTSIGFYDINCFDKEVIGNVTDSPELLKRE